MPKKLYRVLALLAFLVTIGAVGAMQYFNMSKQDKGEVAENAADAVDAATNAARDWTKDRSERSIEVVTLIGQTPQVTTIRTLLTMQGASKLSEVCASLPRVRDAINVMLFDRTRAGLQSGRRIDLATYEAPLKAALNRAYEEPVVERVRLSLGNAAMADSGCTDRGARGGGGERSHEAAVHGED